MSYSWDEMFPTSGKKKLAVHEMADGFLITLRWNWPEADVVQEIVFFSPLVQAREIAEQILEHIGRLNLRNSNRGAPQINRPRSPRPDDDVPGDL